MCYGPCRIPGPLASWNVSSGCGARLRGSLKGVVIASIAAALAWVDLAQGDVCPQPGENWLRVAFSGNGFTPALRTRVIEQLGAEFHAHGLGLCEALGSATEERPPLADIVLVLSAEALLSLQVRDAVTDK